MKDYVNPVLLQKRMVSEGVLGSGYLDSKRGETGNYQPLLVNSCTPNYKSPKESKTKVRMSRRNASLEIILENGQMKSHRDFKPKKGLSPGPEVYESTDIKITNNMVNTIQKRARAAFKQAMQGEQKFKNRDSQVCSPWQRKLERGRNSGGRKTARSKEKLGKQKKFIRRVSQEQLNTGNWQLFTLTPFLRIQSALSQSDTQLNMQEAERGHSNQTFPEKQQSLQSLIQ